MLDKFIKKIKTELDDEFDRNFERQGFFSQKWKKSNTKGTTLIKSGALRKSIQSQINGNTITYTSSVPYANIHNNGIRGKTESANTKTTVITMIFVRRPANIR